jgi:phosphoribosylformimino-5-aminoimidazole carboxamide ribotide isomerase
LLPHPAAGDIFQNQNFQNEKTSVQIIPVIDLMGGCVVHAKRGQRDQYQPIQTPLCQGATPEAVIDGLLNLHSFKTFYIADLDALTGKKPQWDIVERLQCHYPTLDFWLDQGWGEAVGRAVPVIGTESLNGERVQQLSSLQGQFILSLDFSEDRLLGESSVLDDIRLWPDKVIVMSLSYVGAGEGPDFQRLREIQSRQPDKALIAAGGVRHAGDLLRLKAMGVAGVLLASALHSGAVGPLVLRELERG